MKRRKGEFGPGWTLFCNKDLKSMRKKIVPGFGRRKVEEKIEFSEEEKELISHLKRGRYFF